MTEGLALSLRDLSVPGDGGRVLLALDALDLAPGQALGVRGVSGAGKSTLILALAGLAPGLRGSLRWGGHDLCAMDRRARATFRRDHVGLVFQDYPLFDELSPAANAAMPALFASRARRAGIRARAAEGLRRLGVPEGDRRVARFSGGERQRVAVARALAGDPAVILADEPTANLDRAAADLLARDLLAMARQGRTLVVASHDDGLLARMDRVVTLGHGKLLSAA